MSSESSKGKLNFLNKFLILSLLILLPLIMLSSNCSADGQISNLPPASVKINVNYVANYGEGHLTDRIYLGTELKFVGKKSAEIPLVDSKGNLIIDAKPEGKRIILNGLWIGRGADSKGKYIQFATRSELDEESRQSIKFNVEFENGTVAGVFNKYPGITIYENANDGKCGIKTGKPQFDNPKNDEISAEIGGTVASFCSITDSDVDRVRLYYEINTPQPPTALSITDVKTAPAMPLRFIEGDIPDTNINLDFISNKYPLNVSFELYNANNNEVIVQGFNLASSSSLPASFNVPKNLEKGVYNLKALIQSGNEAKEFMLGEIVVNELPLISNIKTAPVLPISLTEGSINQNILINFDSRKFPLNYKISLIKGLTEISSKSGKINDNSQLPIIFEVPSNLSSGEYSLTLSADDGRQSNSFVLGKININKAILPNAALNITNLIADPIPVFLIDLIEGSISQNILINFDSNIFPIDAEFDLLNNSGYDVNKETIHINSKDELPLEYNLPQNLIAGNYSLYLKLNSLNGQIQMVLGNVVVNKAPENFTIGNLTTNPVLPINLTEGNTNQYISIDFKSNKFPINISIGLYGKDGLIKDISYSANSEEDIVHSFLLPSNLMEEAYYFLMTAQYGAQIKQLVTEKFYVIKQPVFPPVTGTTTHNDKTTTRKIMGVQNLTEENVQSFSYTYSDEASTKTNVSETKQKTIATTATDSKKMMLILMISLNILIFILILLALLLKKGN